MFPTRERTSDARRLSQQISCLHTRARRWRRVRGCVAGSIHRHSRPLRRVEGSPGERAAFVESKRPSRQTRPRRWGVGVVGSSPTTAILYSLPKKKFPSDFERMVPNKEGRSALIGGMADLSQGRCCRHHPSRRRRGPSIRNPVDRSLDTQSSSTIAPLAPPCLLADESPKGPPTRMQERA